MKNSKLKIMIDNDIVQAAVRYCMRKVRKLEPEEKIETLIDIRVQLMIEADKIDMKVRAEGNSELRIQNSKLI